MASLALAIKRETVRPKQGDKLAIVTPRHFRLRSRRGQHAFSNQMERYLRRIEFEIARHKVRADVEQDFHHLLKLSMLNSESRQIIAMGDPCRRLSILGRANREFLHGDKPTPPIGLRR